MRMPMLFDDAAVTTIIIIIICETKCLYLFQGAAGAININAKLRTRT